MTQNTKNPSKKVDLSPNKEIYRSAAVDVNPIDAVEELDDNALDNWARVSQRVDNMTIDITAEDTLTRVRDDSGGLEADDIRLLFALGETFQQEVAGSIGSYGIGAKKALVRLGEERIVKSRARGADTGVGFRVNEEWLDSNDWEVELEEFPDLEEGVTELETHASEQIWDDERVERLKQTLRETYAKFLGRSAIDGTLTIRVNGEELEPPEEIPWAFTPFDGLHPRRFESIEIHPKGIDAPVKMDVTVGQMRNADSGKAGTDIYIQDRLVTKNERGEVGGFGSVAEDRIGNFTSQNNRLRVVVELSTDGDSSDLPWDGQKTTIDPYHPVSRALYDWLRRIVRPYFKADSGKVPAAFVEPFTPDHEGAANGGEVEVLDYSSRSNVNDKPDDSLSTVKEVRKKAESHAKSGMLVTDIYEGGIQVAYEAHVRSQFKGDDEDLELITAEELAEREVEEVNEDDLTLSGFLGGINGAGARKEEALRDGGFKTVEDLANATISDLTDITGIGTSLAKQLKQEASSVLEGDATSVKTEAVTEKTQTKKADEDEEESDSDRVQIPLEMSDEEFNQLRQQLDLDEDATPEEIGQQLTPRILGLFLAGQ